MPDPYSIPFRQAEGNGHYKSKELPDDKQDFLTQLGVPSVFGDVLTGETSTVTGQLTLWYGTDGHTIKAVPTSTSGIVVAQNGVGTFEPHPAGAIVGTDAVQTLTNKTFGTGIVFGGGVTFTGGVTGLTKSDVGLSNVDNTSDAAKNSASVILTNKTISLPLINSPTFSGTVTGLTKTSVGLGNVDNTSDLNKPISSQTQSALDGKENLSRYNVANGYAPLGSDSKVPLANMPDAALGGSRYQGTWNALTNIPPVPPAAASNNGWYYVVSQAGNTSLDGINIWALGDTAISNGTYWQKIPNTNAVVSVNGKTGTVVLNKTDVGLSNVDNTSDSTKNSAAATLTNKTINGASNTLTVRLDSDVTNNLPVSRLNGGTGASAATFWRGDGLWVSPTGAGDVQGPGTATDGEVTLFSGTTGKVLRTFGGAAGFAKVGPSAALTTVPSIGALDVNASLIHGQTQKTSATALDEFLVWDSAASALKSMRYSTVIPPKVVIGDSTQGTNPAGSVIVPYFANHPDQIFGGTPSALDDHFEGSTLNAKWTPTGSSIYTVTQVANSMLGLGARASSPTDNIAYLNQVSTAVPNTNSFTVTVKVRAILAVSSRTGSIAATEVILYNNTSSVGALFALQCYYVSSFQQAMSMSACGGSGVGTQVYSWLLSNFPEYLRMVYLSTDSSVSFHFSMDGRIWEPWVPLTSAQSGFTGAIKPQVFILRTNLKNDAWGISHFDWVTFTNP